jgi:hypothetical protein
MADTFRITKDSDTPEARPGAATVRELSAHVGSGLPLADPYEEGALYLDGDTVKVSIATPIAISDFKNGVYQFGGDAKTLEDLWTENTDWDTWDPVRYVIAGVGLHVENNPDTNTATGPVATADLLDVIGFNFTAVMTFTSVADADTVDYDVTIGMDVGMFSDYSVGVTYKSQLGGSADSPILQMSTYDTPKLIEDDTLPVSGERCRVALTFSGDGAHFALSTNGGAVQTDDHVYDNSSAVDMGIFIAANANPNPWSGTLESIKFYRVAPDAALPVLSAL